MPVTQTPVRFCRARTVVIATACVSIVIVFHIYKLEMDFGFERNIVNTDYSMHDIIVDQFYQSRKYWQLSKLGNILFKNEGYPELTEENKNKNFVVLIWKHWDFLKKRHLYYFGKHPQDPLKECSVKNCEFTGDDGQLQSADAVIVHLLWGNLPLTNFRSPSQIWIFLSDESPFNTFSQAPKAPLFSALHNVFNWSMTYRSISDVPVPYGRTVGTKMSKLATDEYLEDLIPNWKSKRRDVLVAILMSNCGISYRMQLIYGLQEHIHVDVHGKCGDKKLKNSCPGHFRADCEEISHYLFYLALENSKCTEYMTEKLFHNAYSTGAIPIIQGPSIEECERYLPPNSYLHVDNYESYKDLAEHITRLSKNEKDLLVYHEWRNDYEVLEEHGFLGTKSVHLCRVCEALNYNDKAVSVYSESRLYDYLIPSVLCRV